MGDERVSGRKYLTDTQYADDRNLRSRQSIYGYQQPLIDIWGRAYELAGIEGEETLLDVGCGNGRYLTEFRRRGHRGTAIGLDLSVGMLTSVDATGRCAADAEAIPARDACVDVTLAMHMLYHVPDRAAAVAELRRVTRPGGVLVVCTNSESHLREFDSLLDESATAVTGDEHRAIGMLLVTHTLENGAPVLEAAFGTVERHDFVSELVVTDVEPLVNYAASMRAFLSDRDDEVAAILDEVRRRAQARIDRDGAFRIRTHSGCFVCR